MGLTGPDPVLAAHSDAGSGRRRLAAWDRPLASADGNCHHEVLRLASAACIWQPAIDAGTAAEDIVTGALDEVGMTQGGNPFWKRRRLANLLREHRQRSGLNLEEAASALYCSPTKISRLETGQRPANPRDVRDLCVLYRVADAQREEMMALAVAGRQPGWWEAYEVPEIQGRYLGLEAEAGSIRDYKSSMVSGLLQTEDYAYAVTAGYFLPVDPLVVRRLTDARMQRQQIIFGRSPLPRMHFLLDEAVLHRRVGTAEVMAGQLGHMVEVAAFPEATIQVVPFSAGAHAGMETTFAILDFADKEAASIVHVEDVFGDIQLERPHEIERSAQVFDRVAAVALDAEQSIDLLLAMQARYQETVGEDG
ncbi:hypothetical protein CIK06_13270 [Plantactinospora sp. KBS50]|nr:hypothetical protein CIK06_13270 [Plantactinospora sp. KBS50]